MQVTSFTKKKENASSSGGSFFTNVVRTTTYATKADALSTARYIWGQAFDGSADITGDFYLGNNYKMAVDGFLYQGSPYNQVSYWRWLPTLDDSNSKVDVRRVDMKAQNFSMFLYEEDDDTELTFNSKGFKSNGFFGIESKELRLQADKMEQAFEEGNFDLGKGWLKANSVHTNNIYSQNTGSIYIADPVIMDGGLELNGDLKVQNLYSKNIDNEETVTTKDLVVTGNSHFFNLVIDEVKHAQGQIVLSPGSFHIDDFEEVTETVTPDINYGVAGEGQTDLEYKVVRLYQICEKDGEIIHNTIQPGDHVLCYTANVTDEGVFDARSWWTLCTSAKHKVSRQIEGEIKNCNVIDIVSEVRTSEGWTDPIWGKVVVKIDDNCAVVGSHNADRRAAILMCAYKSFDMDVKAPCIAQYKDIDGFSLEGKAWTYFSESGNKVRGELVIDATGEDVQEKIENEGKLYFHTAWSNSEDGRLDFCYDSQKDENLSYKFKGIATNKIPDETELRFGDYYWYPVDGRQDKLIPARERLYLASDDCLYLDVEYITENIRVKDYKIYAEITNYLGAKTTRQINRASDINKTLYYCGVIQQNWSDAPEYGSRYDFCTVYLADGNDNIFDSRSFAMTTDHGAILSVTDDIKARVTDDEGNINTLVMTAKYLRERITSAESTLDLLITDKSLELMIDNLKGKTNNISIDVDGLHASLRDFSDEQTQKWADYEVTIDGIKGEIKAVDGYARTQVARIDISLAGLTFEVSDKIVGAENLIDQTDFGIDETTDKWTINSVTFSGSAGPESNHGYATFSSGSYLSQALDGELKPACWYTLSLYTNDPSKIRTYFSTDFIDQSAKWSYCGTVQENVTLASDCDFTWRTDSNAKGALNGFKRYWLTFKTNTSWGASGNIRITFSASGSAKLGLVKMEEGRYMTSWDYSPRDRSARFKVTPEEIYLGITNFFNETSIKITDGQVIINADETIFTGNITLSDPNQGLIILDSYGNPRINIQNNSLGTLENFDFGADKSIRAFEKKTISSATSQVDFPTMTIDLGSLTAGRTLKFHSFGANAYWNDNPFHTNTDWCQINCDLRCNGTSQETWSQTVTSKNPDKWPYEYQMNDHSTQAASAGTYTLVVTGRIKLLNPDYSKTGQMNFQVGGLVEMTYSSINRVAIDGAVFASASDEYNWFGSDKTVFNRDGVKFMINSHGLLRNCPAPDDGHVYSQWTDASSTLPTSIVNVLTYTAGAYDAFICFSSVIGSSDEAQRTLTLPAPNGMHGKLMYVKNIVGWNTVVKCVNQNNIIRKESNEKANEVQINSALSIFLCDGWDWIQL